MKFLSRKTKTNSISINMKYSLITHEIYFIELIKNLEIII